MALIGNQPCRQHKWQWRLRRGGQTLSAVVGCKSDHQAISVSTWRIGDSDSCPAGRHSCGLFWRVCSLGGDCVYEHECKYEESAMLADIVSHTCVRLGRYTSTIWFHYVVSPVDDDCVVVLLSAGLCNLMCCCAYTTFVMALSTSTWACKSCHGCVC